MANMMLLFGLVILGMANAAPTAAPAPKVVVALTCHELNMAASFAADLLKGKRIISVKLSTCKDGSYKVDGGKVTANFKDCAKAISQDATQITQENEAVVVSGFKDEKKKIERVVVNTFTLQCKFDRKLQLSTSAVNVADKQEQFADTQTTDFSAGMAIYETSKFSMVASDPYAVIAYQPIHVQIKGTHDNSLFKFVTKTCYATPTADPNHALKFYFFMDRCAFDDSYTVYNAGVANQYQFSIEAFTFIKLKGSVHFHCELLVCKAAATSEACQQKCGAGLNRKRRAIAADDDALESVMVRSNKIKWQY